MSGKEMVERPTEESGVTRRRFLAALPKKPHVFTGKPHLPHHLGTGRMK